jgi:hypothetical protein
MSASPELTAALAQMAESPAALPNLTLAVVPKACVRFNTYTGERIDSSEVWLRESADPDARSVALMVQPENQAAHAHRIAACVNACAGVSDPRALPDLLDELAFQTVKALLPAQERPGGAVRYDCSGNFEDAPKSAQLAATWLLDRGFAELERDVDTYGGDEVFTFIRMVQP